VVKNIMVNGTDHFSGASEIEIIKKGKKNTDLTCDSRYIIASVHDSSVSNL
jgi:hypothetical protein